MAKNGIEEEDIPEETTFPYTENSKRYFTDEGAAWFTCPNNHWWTSNTSRCVIDLKEQTICNKTKQICAECMLEVVPEFTEEVILNMANSACHNCSTLMTGRRNESYTTMPKRKYGFPSGLPRRIC